MSSISQNIAAIRATLPQGVQLVCVSKFHPAEAILEAYNAGERDFGESRVQELCAKQSQLPKDIRWHFIGHLQTNKVRQIVPFVYLIHSVDSVHLMETINAEAARINRVVNILLDQVRLPAARDKDARFGPISEPQSMRLNDDGYQYGRRSRDTSLLPTS